MFKVIEKVYKDRTGNLKAEAKGEVSSTKYFPTYGNKIFKPLSKTKPLSTPLFAYAEVYWSYLTNKYIDSNTPKYSLARCYGIGDDQPKYFDKGTMVENILGEDESLVSILELFRMYPEKGVNIDDYINYCEMIYDFEPILTSEYFTKHKDLARKLAEQILCSILRRDDNYHFENASLVFKDGEAVRVAPIIDSEFSQFFMFPDFKELHEAKFSAYDEGMLPIFKYNDELSYEENVAKFLELVEVGSIYDNFNVHKTYLLMRNIKCITLLFPDLVKEFIDKIILMRREVEHLDIEFNDDYLGEFSSWDWEATRMVLKDGKSEDDAGVVYAKKKACDNRIKLNHEEFNWKLKREVLFSIDHLIFTLEMFLGLTKRSLPDLRNFSANTLYKPIERYPEQVAKMLVAMMAEVKKKELK